MVVETVGSGEGDLVGISLFCKVVFKALMLTLLGCGGAGLLGINDNFLAETKCQLFTSTTTFLVPLQFKPRQVLANVIVLPWILACGISSLK